MWLAMRWWAVSVWLCAAWPALAQTPDPTVAPGPAATEAPRPAQDAAVAQAEPPAEAPIDELSAAEAKAADARAAIEAAGGDARPESADVDSQPLGGDLGPTAPSVTLPSPASTSLASTSALPDSADARPAGASAATPDDVSIDALISAALARAPDDSAALAALAAYADGVARTFQREHGIAAMSLAVVKDNAPVFTRHYGLADVAAGHAAGDQTLFRIGSVSKTFTWTAVMMLVERGLIDLDTDVNSYLKSVRIAEAFGAPVTMRHLMHHRAGFEDSLRVFAVGDDDPRSLAQLLSEHQPARVYAPGQRTSYSNWGSALAAQIVADVSGLDYAAFLQREILDPLGMRATTFIAPSKLDAQTRAALATGYKAQQGALGVQNYMQLGAYWPAGGLACTASDMARWMRFHLNGGELDGVRLMRAETHRSMWTRGYDDRPAGADLAHGFQDRSYRGLRLLGHGGATAAFFTNMVLVPELSLGIFVSQSSQQTRLSVSQLPELLIDQLTDRHYAPALAAEPGAAAPMAEFAGTYVPNRRVFSSFAAVLGLVNTLRVSAIDDGTLLVAGGGQAHQYRRLESDRDTFESAEGARLAFVREGQAVVALADGSGVHSFEKAHGLNHPTTMTGALAVATLLALTTLLGFWWRLGRGTDYGQGLAAGVAASASILGALAMLGLIATLAMLAQVSMDVSAMPGSYPPPSMRYVHYAAWAVAGVAGFGLLALWPAWRADGWGFWRRTHFSLFALTLALLAYQLWQWRLFGAPVY